MPGSAIKLSVPRAAASANPDLISARRDRQVTEQVVYWLICEAGRRYNAIDSQRIAGWRQADQIPAGTLLRQFFISAVVCRCCTHQQAW